MLSIDEFVDIVEGETGLELSNQVRLDEPLSQLDGWNSIYVLSIASEIRSRAGKAINLSKAFDARTLRDMWSLADE